MPTIFAIIDHDGAHPSRQPGDPAWKYVANWMAWRPRDRKVFVQVEADAQAGIAQFRQDYPQAVTRADGTVPDDAKEWKILYGEPDDLIEEDEADPAKVGKRIGLFKARLERQDKLAREARDKAQKEKAVKP